MTRSSLVSGEALAAYLEDPTLDVVVADCRFVMGQPDAGRQSYETAHIPGAVYFDLERELSAPVTEHGGRHPLPDLEGLAAKLGQAGIGAATLVVAYDDQGGAMAARLWWLLQYMGHVRCSILDGGFAGWVAAGRPVTADTAAAAPPQTFALRVQPQMLVSMADVRERIGRAGAQLIDSREAARFLGSSEPIDPVAGHIPGAANYFWKNNLDDAGRWLPADELARKLHSYVQADEIIVYCGSGVTACPNVLALQAAGFTNVKLYAGSWSDWISYGANPIAVGEE